MLQWRWLLARLVGLIISALERFWRGVRVRLGDCVVVERDLGGGEKSWKGEVCRMVVRVWGEACCGGESSSSGMIRQCRGVEWREEVFGRGEQYCGGISSCHLATWSILCHMMRCVQYLVQQEVSNSWLHEGFLQYLWS